MQLHSTFLFFLLLRLGATAAEKPDVTDVQADEPRHGHGDRLCRYNEKELHITVRSAALSALKGLCNPAEMEARLLAMEERLSRKLEDIKNSFSRSQTHDRANTASGNERDQEGRRRSGSSTSSAGAAGDSDSDSGKMMQQNEYRTQRRYNTSSSRRRASAKRYGAAHKSNVAAASQRDRANSRSGASEATDTRSASAQTASRRSGAETAVSRAAGASSRTSSSRPTSAPTSSYNTRDRFASAQSTRSSSVRSVSADAFRGAAEETRNSSATYAASERDNDVKFGGSRRTSSSNHQNTQLNQRFVTEPSGKTYRYELVPRRGYVDDTRRATTTTGNLQYETHGDSQHASGMRQVSASSLGSRTGRNSNRGDTVAYSSSYTPSTAPEAYSAYGGGRQQRPARSRRLGRRQQGGRRRSQQVTDTVSYVSSSESAKLSRFREISNFNDTVYEMNGKRMYSYYWEVKDFDTMMVTWEERHSLRSPSFYVYQGGYRMYIRVFPSRQGGNVYLHAGLTPGRYDDSLQWPFRLRLRLSLLDHSAVSHDILSRIWDPTQLCSGFNWRKPTTKDNYECVGLGFPQELLRSRRFILDGSVLIKLDVFLEE